MSKEMTNKELFDSLNDSIATAIARATSSQAGSGAGAANARTQSNKEADSAIAVDYKDQQVDSDIGIEEAWSANVKRTYDVHQTYDLESQVQNRTHFNTMVTEQQKYLSQLNQMSLQAIANNQNQSNLNNLLGIDRAWNINETDLAAKSVAVLTDAVLAEIGKRQG